MNRREKRDINIEMGRGRVGKAPDATPAGISVNKCVNCGLRPAAEIWLRGVGRNSLVGALVYCKGCGKFLVYTRDNVGDVSAKTADELIAIQDEIYQQEAALDGC